MAPSKKIADSKPAFFEDDVREIEADWDGVPADNDQTEIEIEGHPGFMRNYRYVKGAWTYEGTFQDGKKVADPTLPAVAEKKPRATKAKKAQEPEPVLEEEIVEDEVKEDEPAAAPAAPVAEKKKRKPSAAVNLNDVMELLSTMKIDDAKKKLKAFIDKHGAEGKPKRAVKNAAVDENGAPKEKKPSKYNIFISAELKRLAEIEKEKPKEEQVPPKDRMKIAMAAWNEHKKTLVE